MVKLDVVDPHTNQTQGVRCNGHVASGVQRYIGKLCPKTLQLNFCNSEIKPDTHQTIANVVMNGSGCRDTARSLGNSFNTVLRHLKKFVKIGH